MTEAMKSTTTSAGSSFFATTVAPAQEEEVEDAAEVADSGSKSTPSSSSPSSSSSNRKGSFLASPGGIFLSFSATLCFLLSIFLISFRKARRSILAACERCYTFLPRLESLNRCFRATPAPSQGYFSFYEPLDHSPIILQYNPSLEAVSLLERGGEGGGDDSAEGESSSPQEETKADESGGAEAAKGGDDV